MRAGIAALALSGLALCWAAPAAQACQTNKQLPDGEVVTPIACAIDALIAPNIELLRLESKETLDTRLVSVERDTRDRRALVTQVDEHWLYSDQVEAMQNEAGRSGPAVSPVRERMADTLPGAICAALDAEALQFFRVGGSLQVVVTLRAVDKLRNADSSLAMADITINRCGES